MLFILEEGHLIIDDGKPITRTNASLVENGREKGRLAQVNGFGQSALRPTLAYPRCSRRA
jgi:hypothetical protein